MWHEGLLFKLEQNGVSGSLLSLMRNYLSDRKQRVVLNGSSSSYYPIESGVPQGSVLGPLLFLIYINDLEKDIKSKIKFFADDSMLFSIVHDPATTAAELKHNLDIITKWAHQWKMSFNPEPTKQAIEVLFSTRRTKVNHPPLFFNNSLILKKGSHKHLGLILDSKLAFTIHINEKIEIAKKFIGVLKYLSNYLPHKTLNQMYKIFVRPHLDYADIIYHIPHIQNAFDSSISLHPLMERIEQIQYQAALAITGCWRGSSRQKLYEELGWESLSDRRWSRRLIHIYKIRNNMTPQYLRDNLPMQRGGYLRNSVPTKYHEISCNSTRYMNSFFPDSVKSWNIIGVDFCSTNSIAIFKKNIINLIRPVVKSHFGIHDPIGLKILYQLRVGLSPLKCHKKQHNFVDTPNDWCDCRCAPENSTHYLISCDLYALPRLTLRSTVLNILQRNNLQNLLEEIEIYLYGHPSLSFVDNKNILLSTITFFKESKRFSNF